MRIVEPSFQLITAETISKKIERVARVCYKSEEKIGEGSDKRILTTLLEKKHYAMLEHGDMCIHMSTITYEELEAYIRDIKRYHGIDSFLRLSCMNGKCLVSGNMRAWIETLQTIMDKYSVSYPTIMSLVKEKLCDLDFFTVTETPCRAIDDENIQLIKPEEFAEKLTDEERMIHETFTVLFTVDRGVTHEFVRMRKASFAQESTRYCNYSICKFDNQLTIIKPIGFDEWTDDQKDSWKYAMQVSEDVYMHLTKDTKMTAQMARGVLPQNVKSDIVITSNLQHWKHIFSLRACDSTGPAHPQMKEVMQPLLTDMRPVYPFAFGDMKMPQEI